MDSANRLVRLGRQLSGVFIILAMFAAIAVPNYRKATMVWPGRRCFINQRKLASAIEMFQLDNNKQLKKLDSDTFRKLVKDGYLEEVLIDPTMGKDSWQHYQLTSKGKVFCTHHGFAPPLKGKGASPREQLIELGEPSKELIAKASTKFHFGGKLGKNPIPFAPATFLFASISLYCFFWLYGSFASSKKIKPVPTKEMFANKD